LVLSSCAKYFQLKALTFCESLFETAAGFSVAQAVEVVTTKIIKNKI